MSRTALTVWERSTALLKKEGPVTPGRLAACVLYPRVTDRILEKYKNAQKVLSVEEMDLIVKDVHDLLEEAMDQERQPEPRSRAPRKPRVEKDERVNTEDAFYNKTQGWMLRAAFSKGHPLHKPGKVLQKWRVVMYQPKVKPTCFIDGCKTKLDWHSTDPSKMPMPNFIDGDNRNIDPSNIRIVCRSHKAKASKLRPLDAVAATIADKPFTTDADINLLENVK